jgi:hypothetical protein
MPIKSSDLSKLVKLINSSKSKDEVYSVLSNAGFNTSVSLHTLKKEYRGKNQAAVNLILTAQDKFKVFDKQE